MKRNWSNSFDLPIWGGVWIRDYAQLVKFRLTMMVVVTAIGAYVAMSGFQAPVMSVILLGIGGFCVAGASNALNQVLETDYDRIMTRTALRPVVTGRISPANAVMTAGLMCLAGVTLLSLFNVLAAMFGMIAFILYAFVYTPLKRYSSAAVLVGAIAGALPMLIGAVAWEGQITWVALLLFLIQFSWQYPHFWAIGYLGFSDYRKAGFRFIPVAEDGGPGRQIAMSAVFHSVLLIGFLSGLYYMGSLSPLALVASLMLTALFISASRTFYRRFDTKAARKLMFVSLIYIPFVLMIILIDKGIF